MAGEWRDSTVGDFAPFTYGKGLSEDKRNPEGEVPVFGSNGMIGAHDEALTSGPTVIIGRKGSVGAVHYSPVPCWPIDTTFWFSEGDENLIRFKYYMLKSLVLERMNTDSAVPGLNRTNAHSRHMLIPPLAEQRAIAHILGTLDDKIELNRQMSETLEAIARALFKSWFVDFDPVRAKAEGRDPGLPKPIAVLFPDSLEGTELGEIPAGWKVRDLSQVTAQITKGTTPTQNDISNAPTSDSQITFLRVNAIADDGSILFDKLTKIPETVHKGALKRSILRTNDVVYTIAGTIGRIGVIEDDLLPANTNQAVAIIRPKPGVIPPGFLVMTMRLQGFQEELHSNIVHAVQANLSLGMISRAKAVFPPLKSLDKIFKPIEDIMRKASTNRREARTLATLRDTLLPKLISGKLRVQDAERIVEIV